MSLEILNAGLMATLQDYGRFGYQEAGMSNGGPMDEHAFLWANYLLSNHYNAPQLEICMAGLEVRFSKNTMIAICGANLGAMLNGKPLANWQSHFVQYGDVLKFTKMEQGVYAYLAIKHGFRVIPSLSSVSTVMREKLGGLKGGGKPLVVGDEIAFEESAKERDSLVPEEYIPHYSKDIVLRFFPNRSVTGSSDSVIEQFSQQTFMISRDINRMGYRLKCSASEQPLLIDKPNRGILSHGVPLGSIQLPKSGQPIVLMKDRQTIGGYPLLGNVVRLDLPKLSQSLPDTKVRFKLVEILEVEQELIEFLNFFDLN